MSVTLFGNTVLADGIQTSVNMSSYWNAVSPQSSMPRVLRSRDKTPTERRMPRGDGDWIYAAASRGTPRTAGSHQKLGQGHGTDSLCELLKQIQVFPGTA